MDFSEYLAEVVKNIARLRAGKNITQEGMDDGDFNIPVSTYAKIEQNVYKDIKLSSIFQIANRLGVEPNEILKIQGQPKDRIKPKK